MIIKRKLMVELCIAYKGICPAALPYATGTTASFISGRSRPAGV
jgi:hypothetical protein